MKVTLSDIHDAQRELQKYFPQSPLLLNSWLSESLGCDVYLKLENMTAIGSFKIRGATYKISRLSDREKKRGVIAASAGNHAQGVAWGSRQLKVSSLIVMPRSAALVKIQNTRALGAEVRLEGDNFDDACDVAAKIARKTGRIFVHAFEDPDVIAGQGTIGLEILSQLPDADCVIGSIGGGGMMAGVSTVFKELRPRTRIVGCQASGASSMLQSIKKGRAISLDSTNTFADGIAVKAASEKLRRILAPRLDAVVEADDDAIASAVLTMLEKAKVVTEGSGALPLAALEKLRKPLHGKKVVLIVSGGNIDVNLLSRIIDRGLIRAGRRLRVNVWVADRPGSLARLTGMIAEQGANVLQTIHDRNEPSTQIDQTEVALTLETKGSEHSEAVIKALEKCVERVELAH